MAREIDASEPNARAVNGALVKNELTQREQAIAAYYRPGGCEDRKVNGNKLPVAGCRLPVKTNTLSVVRGQWSVAKTEH
jgi:hypothetical protein